MGKEYKICKIIGLRLSIEPLFLVGTIILWIFFSAVGLRKFDLDPTQAIGVGFIVTLLYWLSEIVHQLGHAYAAHRTGYPMMGIHMGKYLIFSISVYPQNEKPLPPEIHIRRALGGPIASFILTVVSGVIAFMLYPVNDIFWSIVWLLCAINLIVFTIGPFLPLGFTDGSTLLEWWRKR